MKSYLLIISTGLFFISCTKVLYSTMGIKPLKNRDETSILKYANRYNIPKSDNWQLDTTFLSFLSGLDSIKYNTQKKNHYQLLQALYYEQNGTLRAFYITCYAGGFPNLKWNRSRGLNTFLPAQQAPVDSILPLARHLDFLNPLRVTASVSTNEYDYLVLLYWSRFMGRQSKRFIKAVQKNVSLSGDKRVKIMYVNTDNFFKQAL